MNDLFENNSQSWTVFFKKKRGFYRVHGLYEFIHLYHNAPDFPKYPVRFKQTTHSEQQTRKYVLIELPDKRGIERHITIDAVFINDSIHFSPYHFTRAYPFKNNKMRVEHGYIRLEKTETGHFDWIVIAVEAYEQTDSERKKITYPVTIAG